MLVRVGSTATSPDELFCHQAGVMPLLRRGPGTGNTISGECRAPGFIATEMVQKMPERSSSPWFRIRLWGEWEP